MLLTWGNGTGLSYCLKYADDSTDENPVVLAKGVDENGEEFERKIEAMSCFQSQLHSFPASRSLEAIIALAKYRGACVSQVRAEAFEVIRDLD